MSNQQSIELRTKIMKLLEMLENFFDEEFNAVPDVINCIADNFVIINDLLKRLNIEIKSRDKFANDLVSIINRYNNVLDDSAVDADNKTIKASFNNFYLEAKQKLTNRVVIYGLNEHILYLKGFLNSYTYVVGYVYDKSNKINTFLKRKYTLILEKDILDYDFDYIVIVNKDSQKIIKRLIQQGINKEKIVDFLGCMQSYINQYIELYNNDYYRSKLYSSIKMAKNDTDTEVIITGLSYSLRGIVEQLMNKKAAKLALPSQDLYYDYMIANNVICKNSKIKYCIIGIAYYSFNWDLSRTAQESLRILNVYYPIFKDAHNLHLPKDYYFNKGIENIDNVINKSVKSIFIDGIYDYYIKKICGINLNPELPDVLWNKSAYLNDDIKKIIENDRKILGKERAQLHNKLNYPKTVQENKNILRNYLELLKQNNIKATLVVFPTTEYYHENFDINVKNSFYSIINDLNNEYQFQLIDMFKSKNFNINDFADWDHLNKKGAIKMTKILNKVIRW